MVDTLGAAHATLLSGRITSELPFPRADIFMSRKFPEPIVAIFLPFYSPERDFELRNQKCKTEGSFGW